VAYAEEQIRRTSLEEAADAAKQALELAHHKYQTGLIDFITVLDAERSLLAYEDQLVQSAGSITSNLVRLYKALGGGWTSLAHDKKYEVRG
jgi:outer membrane protein TolC